MEQKEISLVQGQANPDDNGLVDFGDVTDSFYSVTRFSGTIGTKESIWQDWLDVNSRKHRLLTADLRDVMPGFLGALIPAQNGDIANIGIWAFFLEAITQFLVELPAYHEDHENNDLGCGSCRVYEPVPWDDMQLFFTELMTKLVEDSLFSKDLSLWKACAMMEQLEPWPRGACDWVIWVSRLGRYVQVSEDCNNMRKLLKHVAEIADNKELPHYSEAARAEFQIVLAAIHKYIDRCSWSYA